MWRTWQSCLARNPWRSHQNELKGGNIHRAPRRLAQLYVQLHRQMRGYSALEGCSPRTFY